MTQFLPPNLLALFAPRDPIQFLTPLDKQPHEKKRLPYGGVAEYLSCFEDTTEAPELVKIETKEERKERRRRERLEIQAYKIEQGIALWDPNSNSKASSDPYKTLFVARINYDTTESKLKREFDIYGPIRKIHMITDKANEKSRGYAFIEYEHERDMHTAYKKADGKKVDGRRVLVDVERGRTVKGWLPRRLGGGLGNTRKARPKAGEEEVRELSRDRSEHRPGERRRSQSHSGSRRRSRDRDRDRSRRSDKERDPRDRDRDRHRAKERDAGGDKERSAHKERERRPPAPDKERDRDHDGQEKARRRSERSSRDERPPRNERSLENSNHDNGQC